MNYKDPIISENLELPREKLSTQGLSALTNLELIALIIGNGNKYNDVFTISKNIYTYLEANRTNIKYSDIINISGIGEAKASKIIASFELANRYINQNTMTITTCKEVFNLCREIGFKKQEHFIILTLSAASVLIKKHLIFIGTLDRSIVHPREIFAQAISDRCANIILVHNHPSGKLEPSNQDLEITKRLIEVGTVVGINVLDHVIIGNNEFYSFYENGQLK